MLRANKTTKLAWTCSFVGGSDAASSSGRACASRMELPETPFSCSSLAPFPRISFRHTARPRQLSIRVPTDALWQVKCSRPNQKRFASANGGMAISSGVRLHKLLIHVLQHQTVAFLSPTPAQRPSTFAAGSSASPIGRHGTRFVCRSHVISGCRGCWTDDAYSSSCGIRGISFA